MDGSLLPCVMAGSGGISKMLRDERVKSLEDKGKNRETGPMFSSHHIGLLYNGRDVLVNQTIGIATVPDELIALLITRSQVKKDARMDLLKRLED